MFLVVGFGRLELDGGRREKFGLDAARCLWPVLNKCLNFISSIVYLFGWCFGVVSC